VTLVIKLVFVLSQDAIDERGHLLGAEGTRWSYMRSNVFGLFDYLFFDTVVLGFDQ